MELPVPDYNAVLQAAEEFSKQGGKITICILYNRARARFDLRGGARTTVGEKEFQNDYFMVLDDCDKIKSRFEDKQVRQDGSLPSQLRTLRIFSLIRIMDSVEKLKYFDNKVHHGKTYAEYWDELHLLISESRGDFPKWSNEEEEVEKQWAKKSHEHLRADEWFWKKISDLEPKTWGDEVVIGIHRYKGKDAKYNWKRIKEVP